MAHLVGRKIAFLHRGSVFGGAEESLLFNARDLLARGAEIVVLSFGTPQLLHRFTESGLESIPGRTPILSAQPAIARRVMMSLEWRLKDANIRWARRILSIVCRQEMVEVKRMISERRIELLYCNMGAAHDYQFIRAGAEVGIKTISHQRREPPASTSGRLLAELNSACTAFLSNSRWTRARWIAQGLREDRHHVIYNTIVPVGEQSGPGLRARAGLPRDARVVASIGRLAGEKHFGWGIQAFGAIAQGFAGWHYLIIGEGEQEADLRRMAANTSVRDRIHFTGEIRNIAASMREIDVVLHPNPEEPFGRVIAEAMLAGCVVVGHASGGVLEMVDDGEQGFLFTTNESLPAVLVTAMGNAGGVSMREKALDKIVAMCGPKNSERLAEVVAAALNNATHDATGSTCPARGPG